MSKYIKVAERERRLIEYMNKIGIKSFVSMVEGTWDYYEIKLANDTTRYWRTKNSLDFESKLVIRSSNGTE